TGNLFFYLLDRGCNGRPRAIGLLFLKARGNCYCCCFYAAENLISFGSSLELKRHLHGGSALANQFPAAFSQTRRAAVERKGYRIEQRTFTGSRWAGDCEQIQLPEVNLATFAKAGEALQIQPNRPHG